MNNYPKILVGGPVSDHHDYCFDSFVKSLKSLTYPNFDILLVDNSKEDNFFNKIKDIFPTIKIPYHQDVRTRLSESRNLARKKVLEEGYDYLFCLDQDVIPPNDILERMINSNKKIITGVYYNTFSRMRPDNLQVETRKLPILWVKSLKNPDKAVPIRQEVIDTGKLIKVDMCGTGCILIHRDILKDIKFRCEEEQEGVDDVFFCRDALKFGFEIWADTSIICNHLVDGRPFNWGEGDMKTV